MGGRGEYRLLFYEFISGNEKYKRGWGPTSTAL